MDPGRATPLRRGGDAAPCTRAVGSDASSLARALLSLLVFFSAWTGGESDVSSRIVLPQGPVVGIRMFSGSRTRVAAYLGIPYALPPTGDLRFAAPARHPGWNGTLYAGHFRPDCPQLPPDGGPSRTEEDCLYLNVFVPELDEGRANLPALVFLHGIEYVSGSPLTVAPEELAGEGLVVVTVSYRLNVFGFLSFEDDYARGNLGLLDQYMAFVWVKENIKFLGGSPGNVVLLGHGSGASCILVHLTSPRTEGLFQGAILMSGSVFSPWLRSRPRGESNPVLKVSRSIARSLGCFGENFPRRNDRSSDEIIACMRKKTKEEILRAFRSSYQNGNWSDALGPVADDFLAPENRYLPEDPVRALRLGKFRRVPLLVGTTVNEGTLTLHKWKDLIPGREEDVRYFAETTAVTDILAKYKADTREARSLVMWNYFEKSGGREPAVVQLLTLYNDAVYAAPFVQQLRILTRGDPAVPTFAYQFAYPAFEYLGNYGRSLNLSEAAHGADLSLLFGPSLFQKVSGRRFTPGEERLSTAMKRFWTSFIRTGNPNPAPYGRGLWDAYTEREPNYIRLFVDERTGEVVKRERGSLGAEADTFWNRLLPAFGNAAAGRITGREDGAIRTPDNGKCSAYRNAMFTVLAFLVILLFVLVATLLVLKKRTKERDRNIL